MPQMGRRHRRMASLTDERAFLRSIDVTFYSVIIIIIIEKNKNYKNETANLSDELRKL